MVRTPQSRPNTADRKEELRQRALRQRSTRSAADCTAVGDALAAAVCAALPAGRDVTVACYVAFGSEPPTAPLIAALTAAGTRVIVPVTLPDRDLDWRSYEGSQPLGVDAIAAADAVVVPALLVDTAGHRLGRGGGSYDRALARVPAGRPVIALVYDDEVVDDVPVEPHDRPVTVVVTPWRVLRPDDR